MTTQANADWRPRLSIDITPEQTAALSKYIPWGMRKMVFSALIDLLIAAFERGGPEVLLSVMQKELDLPALFIKGEPVKKKFEVTHCIWPDCKKPLKDATTGYCSYHDAVMESAAKGGK